MKAILGISLFIVLALETESFSYMALQLVMILAIPTRHFLEFIET